MLNQEKLFVVALALSAALMTYIKLIWFTYD